MEPELATILYRAYVVLGVLSFIVGVGGLVTYGIKIVREHSHQVGRTQV